MSTKWLLAAAVLVCLSIVSSLQAQALCVGCTTQQDYPMNALHPMLENSDISSAAATITQANGWVTLQDSCGVLSLANGGTKYFDTLLRTFIKILTSTAPAGTPYEVQILTTRNGVETLHGTYAGSLRAGIDKWNPQADYYAAKATLTGAAPGHGVKVKFRLNGSGQVKVSYQLTAAHATTTYEGGYGYFSSSSAALDTTWRNVGTLQYSVGGAFSVDAQVQASFRLPAGSSPGQQIIVGFGRGDGSSGAHNFPVYVPASLPHTVTLFDSMPNEGVGSALFAPGAHTIKMWARTTAGTATITNLEFTGIGMPVTSSSRIAYGARTTDLLVRTDNFSDPQPQNCEMLDGAIARDPNAPHNQVCHDGTSTVSPACGRWTKLLEFPIDPSPAGTPPLYTVGSGYIELKGRSRDASGNVIPWAAGQIQLAIEVVTNESPQNATDFHWVTTYAPVDSSRIGFFSDAMSWGNTTGQTVRLWIRKSQCSEDGQYADEGSAKSFTVGKTFLQMRMFDNPNSCLYH